MPVDLWWQMRSSAAGAVVALSSAVAFVVTRGDGAGEYYSAVHVRRRCGLLSNYFDHSELI